MISISPGFGIGVSFWINTDDTMPSLLSHNFELSLSDEYGICKTCILNADNACMKAAFSYDPIIVRFDLGLTIGVFSTTSPAADACRI